MTSDAVRTLRTPPAVIRWQRTLLPLIITMLVSFEVSINSLLGTRPLETSAPRAAEEVRRAL